jgi:hypothetical protein
MLPFSSQDLDKNALGSKLQLWNSEDLAAHPFG